MQKIILDTNVIVSALISNSIPTKILYELVLAKEVETCLSDEIFKEYIEVLGRDKFSKFANFKTKADIVLNKLRENSIFHNTNEPFGSASKPLVPNFFQVDVVTFFQFDHYSID